VLPAAHAPRAGHVFIEDRMSDEEEVELEPLAPDPYPWAVNDDERRRAFVLERLTLDGAVPSLAVLEETNNWLKNGMPPPDGKQPKHLRPVK